MQHNPNNQNYPQRKKKNYETDITQQKQHKQLILIDSKNIFTLYFQPITDGINFIAQQKQRKQLIITNNKNVFITVSNQYNDYNLIL